VRGGAALIDSCRRNQRNRQGRRERPKPQLKKSETDPAKPLLALHVAHIRLQTLERDARQARGGTRDNDVRLDQGCPQPWELSALYRYASEFLIM
jgi:hypothetical protein